MNFNIFTLKKYKSFGQLTRYCVILLPQLTIGYENYSRRSRGSWSTSREDAK